MSMESKNIIRARNAMKSTKAMNRRNGQDLEASGPSCSGSSTIVYAYDGSLEGYYTAVFTAFERKDQPAAIVADEDVQMPLFGDVLNIVTSMEKALRVQSGLQDKLGKDEAERIKMGFLSDDPDRCTKLLHYIQIAMKRGRYAFCDHTNPVVADYEKLWRQVSNERHRMLQFTRFSELEGGVFFAQVNPNANVVPIMMDHFSKRFNTEPFMIFDSGHQVAGVSQSGRWNLIRTAHVNVPSPTNDELEYRRMWKSFYNSICNRERLNPALRRNFMPMRLWQNIVELTPDIERPHDTDIVDADAVSGDFSKN